MEWLLLYFVMQGPRYDFVKHGKGEFEHQEQCEEAAIILKDKIDESTTHTALIACVPALDGVVDEPTSHPKIKGKGPKIGA